MYFEGELRSYGTVNVEPFKKPLLDVHEDFWITDPRYKVNKNFKDSRTLWIYTMPLTPDGIFHIFDKSSLFSQEFNDTYSELNKQVEDLTNGIVIRSGIIRLEPGMSVARHIDGNHLMMQTCHRMLLAVITNDKMIYKTDSQDYFLDEGVLYDVNGYIPHSTHNNGDTARYSFAFDVLPKESIDKVSIKRYNWDEELFNKIAATVPNKPINGLIDNWQQHLENAKKELDK